MPNAPVYAKFKMPKRRGALPPIQRKAMTAIAKKVVKREAETKSAITNISFSQADGFVYAQNLNYFLPQGYTAEQIIGEKFFLKNINIRGEVFNINTAALTNCSLTYRMLVVRTKKSLTLSNTSITASDVFRQSTATRYSTNGHVDMHKVDLLYDKTMYFEQPNQTNTDQHKPFTVNLKINKNHFVDTDNGGFLKDKNYYLIVVADKNTTVAGNSSFIRFSWSLNFKDS